MHSQTEAKDQILLQGDLQRVFDALYFMGIIDPVLKLDWHQEFDSIRKNPHPLARILRVVNSSGGNHKDLMKKLKPFKKKDLNHLALIVAHELNFSNTDKVIH